MFLKQLRLAHNTRHLFGSGPSSSSSSPFLRLGAQTRSLSHAHSHSKQTIQTDGPVELSYSSIIPEDGNATSKPLVILHGLFGSKRNWISICKALHRDMPHRAIYALDMRNHGTSPHATPHTYSAMAEDVRKFIEDKKLSDVALLGHSMGGKAAMAYALSLNNAPDAPLSQVIVVDIAPSIGKLSAEFQQYISAMQEIEALPFGAIKTRSDADKYLQKYEPDLSVRQFLLTNLHLPSHSHPSSHSHSHSHTLFPPHSSSSTTRPDKARFIVPLDILSNSMDELGSFPYYADYVNSRVDATWNGPTLVHKGTRSPYINHKNLPAFRAFFPNMQLEELDAGHWVHAEKPTEFRKSLVKFLEETSS